MFSMNKYIGAHVEPYKPVDLTTSSSSVAPKKRKAKSPEKDKGGGAKKRAGGTQAPYRLSDALVAVVGKSVLPRPQVTQALWAYIRANSLQVRGP
jgi:upstream activation factor subunit UAF30